VQSEDRLSGARETLAEIERDIQSAKESRWSQLRNIFGLTESDADFLQACLAIHTDPGLAGVFAHLQDNPSRNYVTEYLVKRLYDHGNESLCHSESPLRSWNLVIEHPMPAPEPCCYFIDSMIADWLLGVSALDFKLVGKAAIHPPLPPLADWPLEQSAALIARHLKNNNAKRIRLSVSGPAGSGRRTLAAAISARLGMVLLMVDSDGIEQHVWKETYLHAQRQAFLDRNALCWHGEAAMQLEWPRHIMAFPVQFVILEPDQSLPVHPAFIDHRIEMPALTLDERRELWRRYIPAASTWPEHEFQRLVNQHQVTVGEIALASEKHIDSVQQAKACLQESARYRLGELAHRVATPFRMQDLVVQRQVSEVLRDFIYEAEERSALWAKDNIRRLFPQGRSLMALLSGPSGTGKTMSAQVIAAELGLDLFRIDLAAVVSKYVGETSRNLQRILSRARHMDVVLLFDEADALLGRRTEIKDAHDRFANTDTNYLLQALESDYQGIALLSTNRKENIDDAFLRRVRYLIEFPKPDAGQRLILWRKFIAELAGIETLSDTNNESQSLHDGLQIIAGGIELTGAQIKYAVLAALFAARRDRQFLQLRHLLRGVDRELMKTGRVLTERERERLKVNGY
jgi:adenylate kinase family enzyme